MTTVPRPIRARLRTAWKATWGSSQQACTQRSPPLSRRVELVGRAAAGSRAAPPAACRAGRGPRRSKRLGPKPKVTVRREGSRPTVSPVSSGGASCDVVGRRRSSRPAVISAAARDHSRISSRSSARLSSSTRSKAAKWSRSWAGGVDPGLVLAVEGDRAGAVRLGLGGLLPDQEAGRAAEPDAGRAGAGRGQQAATGDRGHRGAGSRCAPRPRLSAGAAPGSRRDRALGAAAAGGRARARRAPSAPRRAGRRAPRRRSAAAAGRASRSAASRRSSPAGPAR